MRRCEAAGGYDLCVWVVIRPEGRVSRALLASGGRAVTDLGDADGGGFVPDTSTIATLCGAAVRALPVKGASVSVMVPAGHRGTVHATDPTAAAIDEWQFTLGEGPAVDAFGDGRPVLVADLQDPALPYGRWWPAFTPAALDAGVRAVYALPQQLGAIRLGAFTLYHDEPGALSPAHLARALQIADTTAIALLHLGHGAPGPAGSGQAADGQLYRAEVYQASGIIRVQLGVSLEEAMIRLRAFAFAEGRPVGDVARDVVARRLRLRRDNPGDNHESETEDE
jgi:hypothetical protein